ncbi:MAG: ATP-dependent helicase, partial [Deltaproteobacteria bacterium]
NAAQRKAVCYEGGHLLIVAGPGTGKTMTLTHRIAQQIQSGMNQPEQILALTFTNKAAREMAERLAALLSEAVSRRIRVRTFHSFCLEALRNEAEKLNLSPDFTLCSELDAALLAREAFSEAGKSTRGAAGFLKALPQLKTARLNHVPLQDLDPVFQRYEKKLKSLGMLDLHDLEVETVRLFQDHPDVCMKYSFRFPGIFVDEYQDTNPLQVALLKLLVHGPSDDCKEKSSVRDKRDSPYALPALSRSAPSPSVISSGSNDSRPRGLVEGDLTPCASFLCAIGDPNQAIYSFRGAEIQNFQRFKEDFQGAAEISLYENYRSAQTLLDGAAALMEQSEALKGHSPGGDFIRIAPCRTSAEEAEMGVEQIEKLIGGTS